MTISLRQKLQALYFGGIAVGTLHGWMGPQRLSTRSSSSASLVGSPSASSAPLFLSLDDADDDTNLSQNITEMAEKKYKLAKAQAEIDRILNSPIDPPFDMEREMKKVVSMSPPLIAEDSPEYELSEEISQMEAELYQAVKQQDYVAASLKSQEISQRHIDDCGSILQVNSRFYQAFSQKNLDDMQQLWLPDRSCICIHPSHKPLVGIHEIAKSYKRMFESSSGSFQKSWMEPHEIRMNVKATTAIITCDQHVYCRRFVRGQKRQTELVNKLQATNIFRKVGTQWYMTYHHSSWHADSEAAKLALGGGNSGKGAVPGSRGHPNGSNSGVVKKVIIRGKQPGGTPTDGSPDNSIDKILGINNFGPLLGDGSGDSSGSEEGGRPNKRIIMGGSLSDILNGGLLGDILGDGKSGGDPNGINGSGQGMEGPEIIQFDNMVGGDDDDEEDLDEDDGEGTKNGQDNSVNKIKEWGREAAPAKTKQTLRQDCIQALRQLATQGRISPKQKRVLLTDIISCSAKGELSMVEVAYELLCSEGGGEDAEEEFADQCIIFCQSIPEYPVA